MSLTIRVYTHGQLRAVDTIDDASDPDALVAKHMALIEESPDDHMIEFENLDIPDPEKRFFRFGTDPRRIRLPLAMDVQDLMKLLGLKLEP